jgi:uncharacterized protein
MVHWLQGWGIAMRQALTLSLSLLLSALPAAAQTQPMPPAAAQPAPPPITKPSFDCSKTKARVLLIVCGDDALAKLDLQEDALLRRAVSRAEQRDAVNAEQDVWLAERNGCGSAACLARAYRNRIADLHRWTN